MLKKLERKLRPFAIPNITLYFIVCQALVYAVSRVNEQALANIQLVPALVLEGEVWRLFTFLVTPPTMNLLFAFFFWYIWYLMGSALEANWGVLRYNQFLLIGFVATAAAAFVAPNVPASNGFLQLSVFLAFAFLFPDFVLHIFFVLPVKIKWLGLLMWVLIGYEFFTSLLSGNWSTCAAILASVLNFLLFFSGDIYHRIRSGRRRSAFQAKVTEKRTKPFHVCTVCGITDRSNPEMEFRYCSQCAGTCGYCTEHIRNHEHVTAPSDSMKT